MEVEEEPSTSIAAAAATESRLMEERYVYEKIKKIEIVLMDEEESDNQDSMIEDPIEETAVVINITINRYTQSSPAAPETMDGTTTTGIYLLEGFLDDDTRLDDLNSLVRNRTVTPRNLEEIKKTILSYSSKIIEIAFEVKRAQLCIEMELDLLTLYSHEEEEDLGENLVITGEMVDDDYQDDQDMFDIDDDDEDDNNDVGYPALPSSVEALETRRFQTKEDLERMIKNFGYRTCMVCLDDFTIDAPKTTGGGISITPMPCSHIFHSECIVPWLGKRYTCPICRCKMPTANAD